RLLGALSAGRVETVFNDIRRSPASWAQLPKTLLSDLRRFPGGPESLRATLIEWSEHPEGKKLIQAALEAWALQEPGYRYVSEMPVLVVGDSTLVRELQTALRNRAPLGRVTRERLLTVLRSSDVVREFLLAHLSQHPRSVAQLEKLLDEVKKNPKGPELMDRLLRRIESREPGAAL